VRILAIDPGTVRLGLALSDPSGTIAQPLSVLARRSEAEDLNTLRDLVERNEVAGYSIDDDFKDSACRTSDDWSAACHRFQVDDAEGLINGRTAEDAGVTVKLDHLGFCHHLLNPDHLRIECAGFLYFLPHLHCYLWSIRRSGA